jgi:hypothetical protein
VRVRELVASSAFRTRLVWRLALVNAEESSGLNFRYRNNMRACSLELAGNSDVPTAGHSVCCVHCHAA